MSFRILITVILWSGISPCGAAILFDSMDSVNLWQVGGGSNTNNRSLTVSTDIKTEGSGSLEMTADYLASGFAYADIYETLPTPLDFSSAVFEVDYRVSESGTIFSWTIGTTSLNYYTVTWTPSAAGTWATASFSSVDFVATPADLQEVDFLQLRVIGDALPTYPATITTNFDNLRVVPEPTVGLLTLLGSLSLFRRRRR